MLYLVFALIGIVLGLLITRKPKAVLLEGIRLLWLIVPAIFLAASPSFLAYSDPEILWTDNNRLLKLLIGAAHAALLLIAVVNIVSAVILSVSSLKSLINNCIAYKKIENKQPPIIGNTELRRQVLQAAAAVMLVLSLFFLTAGLWGHMAVLLGNNGMMPITEEYLQDVDDPVIVEGIRNDALYFKRIIDSETRLPHLGQTIRAERLSFLLPDGFVYISSTELVIAISFSMTIMFSMISDSLRRGKRLLENNSQTDSENNAEPKNSED